MSYSVTTELPCVYMYNVYGVAHLVPCPALLPDPHSLGGTVRPKFKEMNQA